jgi:hypothetical protein
MLCTSWLTSGLEHVNVPAGVYRLLIDSPASGASGMLSAQVSDF